MRAFEFLCENSWKEKYSNPYEVLGLQPGATPQEVQQAYRKMASQYHPDRVSPDQREQATKMMQYVNDAKRSIDQGDTSSGGSSTNVMNKVQQYEYMGRMHAKMGMQIPDIVSMLPPELQQAFMRGYGVQPNRARQNRATPITPEKKSMMSKIGSFFRRLTNIYDPVAANYGRSPWFNDPRDSRA